MATSILFDGRTTSIPGAYTKIDASGLDAVGIGATGIVALIGTAVGGRPISDGMTADDLLRFSTPQAIRNVYKSGALREAGSMAFSPSSDANIPAGAQQVIGLKVNPATQSSADLTNSSGIALTVTSRDYGAFTEQVNILVTAAGSGAGRDVTANYETTTETFTNVGEVQAGSTNMFTLRYDEPSAATGWDTMTAEMISTGLRANGTRAITSSPTLNAASGEMDLTSAADNEGRVVYVFGQTASGFEVDTLVLDAAGTASGTKTYLVGDVQGIFSPSLASDVLITPSGAGGPYTILASAPGVGGVLGETMFVANATVSEAGGGGEVVIHGLSSTGARTTEEVAAAGTSTTLWSRIDFIGTDNYTGTGTLSGVAAETNNTVHATLQSVADYYNSRQLSGVASGFSGDYSGFTLSVKSSLVALDSALLDLTVAPVTCDGVVLGFSAVLYAIVWTLNNSSALVEATRGATGRPPDNFTPAIWLTGGIEGVTTNQHYLDALDLLQSLDVSTIVPLTGEDAVHAALNAHCIHMSGPGKSERDGIVGLAGTTSPFTLPSKNNIRDKILALNSRHLRACGQTISRYNTAGTLTVFEPWYQAVILAGMQAGSSLGTSLTRKVANVVSIAQDSTWTTTNDSNEMIQLGLCFMEMHRTGTRVVRNITTYLQDNNLAFTEASVNEAANYAVFNLRNSLDETVGKKGFAGTLASTRGAAVAILNIMQSEGVIVQWQALTIELQGDTLVVAVEIAPVIPVNFVTATVHLVTVDLVG